MVTKALCLSSSPSRTPAVSPSPLSTSILCLETLRSPSQCREVAMQQQQTLGPCWDARRPAGRPELTSLPETNPHRVSVTHVKDTMGLGLLLQLY